MVKIIDSLYEEVVKKISEKGAVTELSRKLVSLKSNSERTLFVYDVIKDFNLLPDNITVVKDEKRSDIFREHGNKCFHKHEYYPALQYYNMSLLNAPNNSKQLCLAYANRSAVFYAMKRYEECVKDIDRVLSMDYPENIYKKLMTRKDSCLESDVEPIVYVNEEHIAQMLNPIDRRNPQYPCASSKLRVCYTKEMGRHVVATEDINPGEILAVEKPYTACLLKEHILFNCTYCFSISGNLIPCDKCCLALFCSEECKEKAWKEYHSIECSISATIFFMEFTKLEYTALRVVIKARSDHSNWESLIELMEKSEASPGSDQMGMVREGDDLIYDSKYYESINSLSTNFERRSVSDVFQKAITAAALLHLLMKTDFLKDSSEEGKKCVAGMLLQQGMASPTNFHNVSSTIYDEQGVCVTSKGIGSAAYAFLSLLNHSCSPNVVRFDQLGTAKTTLVSIRKIKKGTQIFDNYGFLHTMLPKKSRQSSLSFQYKFDCTCEACENDWPLYSFSLRSKVSKNLIQLKDKLIDPKTYEALKRGSVETALEKFRVVCSLVKKMEDYVPCSELGETQETLKQCAFIVFGLLPYGYSQSVDWQKVLMENV